MKNISVIILTTQMFIAGFMLGDIVYNNHRFVVPLAIPLYGLSAVQLMLKREKKKDAPPAQ